MSADLDDLGDEVEAMRKGWQLFPRGVGTRIGLAVCLFFGIGYGRLLVLDLSDRTATVRCRAGEDEACLWTSYRDFRHKDVYVKEWEQRENVDLACRRGYAPACAKKNLRRSACLFGDDAECARLADEHIQGTGMKYADGAYGVILLEHACDGGGAASCHALARIYGENGLGIVTPDAAHYRDMLRALCERGEREGASSCSELAAVLEAEDAAAARPYYQRACDLGDSYSCAKVPKQEPRL